jgi:hypothetical protein
VLEDCPRLLLILTLSDAGLHCHARSENALLALGLGEMRQGSYVLAQAMARSPALREFTEQFGREGGIAWLMVERTESVLPDGSYRPLVDRSDMHAQALVAWRREGGLLPCLEPGEMVRLS